MRNKQETSKFSWISSCSEVVIFGYQYDYNNGFNSSGMVDKLLSLSDKISIRREIQCHQYAEFFIHFYSRTVRLSLFPLWVS